MQIAGTAVSVADHPEVGPTTRYKRAYQDLGVLDPLLVPTRRLDRIPKEAGAVTDPKLGSFFRHEILDLCR